MFKRIPRNSFEKLVFNFCRREFTLIDLLNFYFILANFSLPDTGEEKIFAEVIFPDLDKEAATKLVEEYNKVININCFY